MDKNAYTRWYAQVYAWFCARPAARKALKALNTGLPAAVFCCYALLLGRLLLDWQQAGGAAAQTWRLVRAAVVPAVVFVLGSLLRRWLNWPRPYEAPGFCPLLEKETRGQSFPSRHALSAGVIAAAGLSVSLPAGACMLALALAVCVSRVLAGVHYPRDVAAGLVLGLGCGLIGTWLF